MREINRAYEVLFDKERRKQYDRQRNGPGLGCLRPYEEDLDQNTAPSYSDPMIFVFLMAGLFCGNLFGYQADLNSPDGGTYSLFDRLVHTLVGGAVGLIFWLRLPRR